MLTRRKGPQETPKGSYGWRKLVSSDINGWSMFKIWHNSKLKPMCKLNCEWKKKLHNEKIDIERKGWVLEIWWSDDMKPVQSSTHTGMGLSWSKTSLIKMFISFKHVMDMFSRTCIMVKDFSATIHCLIQSLCGLWVWVCKRKKKICYSQRKGMCYTFGLSISPTIRRLPLGLHLSFILIPS